MEEKQHFVVFPFPEQGHINPMLQLAVHLASVGASVTFINTIRTQEKLLLLLSAHHPLIRFASIPDGLPHEYSNDVPFISPSSGLIGSAAMPALLRSLPDQAPHLDALLLDMAAAEVDRAPPSCFVSDSFCVWTESVARKHKMAWMVFWSSSATRLCVTVRAMEEDAGNEAMTREIPGLQNLKNPVAVFASRQNQSSHFGEILRERNKALSRADLVVCNTFEAIEGEAMEYLRSRLRISAIGPLCIGAEAAYGLGSLREPDSECLPWLDTQSARSVLYISFGSKVSAGEEAMAKIGEAIEASGRPFLWVLKDGHSATVAMATKIGKIVGWAPQEKVLAHPSVAAFLSHCGWNSVLEALVHAVPLVCWPVFADQPVNRAVVEEKWLIGKGLNAESHVPDIRAAIEAVMDCQDIRTRADILRNAAIQAVGIGGSSYTSFRSFQVLSHKIGSELQ